MLDQTFTAGNFRRVFDSENRKGRDLAGRFFPNLEPFTLSIRGKVLEIRELRSKKATFKPEEFDAKISELKLELSKLKAAKSVAIDQDMETIASKVLMSSFKLSLSQKVGPKSKPVFCIDGSPETFFVIKQLQLNINRIYGVKQSNRHDLVCRFRDTVSTGFPFEIVRTDISSFYESIDRKRLLGKLDTDQLLSSTSKKYIKQVLDSYASIAGAPTGIPRGVGISAYLAELYLRPIDREIKAVPGIVLYCRFVDDILAVFARPPEVEAHVSYQDIILKLLSENGLTNNQKKTKEFKLGVPGPKKFEYLGYRFVLNAGQCAIWPSAAKVAKYKRRMNAAFQDYAEHSSIRSRRAYRDLVSRVKFLTGNTRLANSKSSATTGIYYNNSLVTELSSFQLLDKVLKTLIKGIKRPGLRKRLKKYTFLGGFSERRFHNFGAKELQTIVRAWKHG